jgi:hypothetical protein
MDTTEETSDWRSARPILGTLSHGPASTQTFKHTFHKLCMSTQKGNTHTHTQATHTLACARTHGERVGRTHKRPLSAAVCVKTATSPLVISWLEVVGVAVKAAARVVKKPAKRDQKKNLGVMTSTNWFLPALNLTFFLEIVVFGQKPHERPSIRDIISQPKRVNLAFYTSHVRFHKNRRVGRVLRALKVTNLLTDVKKVSKKVS